MLKQQSKIFLITLIVAALSMLLLKRTLDDQKQEYLNHIQIQNQIIFNAHVEKFNMLSKAMLDYMVDDYVVEIYRKLQSAPAEKKGVLREDLYNHLKNHYKKFKYIKLNQLHFHLKNSESFLRFHIKEKYGDRLDDIRQTINHTNAHSKIIRGFEVGRTTGSYRFVYPIKNNEKHLGSVEISFPIFDFIKNFIKDYKKVSNFHINKEVVDKKVWGKYRQKYYIPSRMEGYYMKKDVVKYLKNSIHGQLPQPPADLIRSLASDALKSRKATSVYDSHLKTVFTFLPIIHPVNHSTIALVTIREKDTYIAEKIFDFWIKIGVTCVLFIILVIYLYREAAQKKKLEVSRIQAEEAIERFHESEFKFRSMVESLSDWIWEVDKDGKLVYSSPHVKSLLGFEPEETIGKTPFDFMPKDEAERIGNEFGKIASEKKAFFNLINKNLHKDGREVIIETSASPKLNQKGDLVGYIGVDRDITSRVENENKIKQQEQLLIQQSKLAAMGEMIGAIAHQWRQPLTAISGSLINIEETWESGELSNQYLQSQLNSAEKGIQFLTNTIDDFRNFFRVSKNKHNFDVIEAINNALAISYAQVNAHGIEFYFSFHDEPKILIDFKIVFDRQVEVFGFANEFTQVILNVFSNAQDVLLSNQVKNGCIMIRVEEIEDEVLLRFSDNGGGIEESIINRVFEPYFTTKEEGKGTGIGMYMSKVIIEDSMDGRISVNNGIEGAEFTITLLKGQKDG